MLRLKGTYLARLESQLVWRRDLWRATCVSFSQVCLAHVLYSRQHLFREGVGEAARCNNWRHDNAVVDLIFACYRSKMVSSRSREMFVGANGSAG